MLNTPVLFLVFNRPDTTAKVFEIIRQIQPAQLFIAADGPRPGKDDEAHLCMEVRNLVLSNIDWNCEVKTLLRKENLGCGKAVSSAITWFFENVEEGIVLEDDTVPDLSFFPYCEALLHKYRDNPTIMHIAGNSFNSFNESKITSMSYYFSSFPFIWGWATWASAWKKYEFDIIKKSDPAMRMQWVKTNFSDQAINNYWSKTFDIVFEKEESFTWDYQWFLSIWKNNGIAILPINNLVKNIGWNLDATHTNEPDHHLGKLNAFSITFPLKHPEGQKRNLKLDKKNFENFYLPYPKEKISLVKRTGRALKRKASLLWRYFKQKK